MARGRLRPRAKLLEVRAFLHQVDGEEHDAFSEGRAQDRLDEDLG